MQVYGTVKLAGGLILSAVLCMPVAAAPPSASSVQAFQESHVYGNPLTQSLAEQLGADFGTAMDIIASAIASSPGSVGEIIKVAINEGVLPVDVAAQCDTALTSNQLRTLITTALNERIDSVPIVERCLMLVEEQDIPTLLAMAINNSTPGEIESVIEAAYNALTAGYADPFQIVKTGVLQSEVFTVDGLESTEGIDMLIEEIRLQDFLETVDIDDEGDQVEVEQDDFETEPPNSSS